MRSGASDASEAHPLALPNLCDARLVLARAPSRVRHLHRACSDHCAHARLWGPCDVSYELCLDTRPRLRSRLRGLVSPWRGMQHRSALRRAVPPRSQVRVTHKFPPLINGTRPPLRQCMRSSPDTPGRGRRRALFLRTITRDNPTCPGSRPPEHRRETRVET